MIRKLLAVLLITGYTTAWAGDGPAATVEQTADELYSMLEENRDSYEEYPAALEAMTREFLLPKLDRLYAGRLMLGRHARGQSDARVEEFAQALGNVLIERYSRQLTEFTRRDQMRVRPSTGKVDPDATRVQTRVELRSGRSADVDYVMHRTESGWQVFDVVVEGVSYVVTFRSQLNEEIQRYGFDSVLDRIRGGDIQLAGTGG